MKNTLKKIIATVAAIVIVAAAVAAVAEYVSTNTVYKTATGKKYHISAKCGGASSAECTLDEALTAGLEPCGKCCKKQISRVEFDEEGNALPGAALVTEIAEYETWINDEAVKAVYTAKDGTTTEIER